MTKITFIYLPHEICTATAKATVAKTATPTNIPKQEEKVIVKPNNHLPSWLWANQNPSNSKPKPQQPESKTPTTHVETHPQPTETHIKKNHAATILAPPLGCADGLDLMPPCRHSASIASSPRGLLCWSLALNKLFSLLLYLLFYS